MEVGSALEDLDSFQLGTVRSVERICRIFSALSPSGITLTELAKFTELSLPTVGRLLLTARLMGFVEKTPENKYVPGPAFLSVAYSLDPKGTVHRQIRDAIVSLRDEVDETVGFYVREGTERYCVDSVESTQLVRRVIGVGHRRPFFLGAPGIVLTAFGDTEQLLSLLPEVYELANGELMSLEELRKACQIAREKGYSFRRQQINSEAWGLSAPVHVSGVLFGALSVFGPITRDNDDYMERCKERLLNCASELSKNLTETFSGNPEPLLDIKRGESD